MMNGLAYYTDGFNLNITFTLPEDTLCLKTMLKKQQSSAVVNSEPNF